VAVSYRFRRRPAGSNASVILSPLSGSAGCYRLHVTRSEAFLATAKQSRPSRLKVQKHRERLRRRGLRPIQIWVPDVRSPAFRAEAHRQSLATAVSDGAREDQAFIDAVSEKTDETR
jgi:hypothetical protein